jgi:N-acetylneuraminic acid mutarotase
MRKYVLIIPTLLLFATVVSAAPNAWRRVTDMTWKRERAVSFVINSKAYFGMGQDSANFTMKDLWEYDPITDTYTQKADLPGLGRRDAFGFALGTKGYVGGGIDTAIFDALRVLKDFYEFNPANNSWTQKADMLNEIFFVTAFAVSGKGYTVCGKTGQANYTDNVYEYDPGNDNWSKVSDFPPGVRYGMSSFVIGNKAYMGFGGDDNLFKYDFYEFNPGNNYSWAQKADFPTAGRTGASGFSIGNYGYISCGNDGGFKKDCWEYNSVSDTWVQRSDIQGDIRKSALAFSIGTKGYLGGGKSDDGTKRDLQEYSQIYESVENISSSVTSITLSPNPFNDFTTITLSNFNTKDASTLVIYDSKGAIVENKKITATTTNIFKGNLEAGLYYVVMSVNEKAVASTKMCIQ